MGRRKKREFYIIDQDKDLIVIDKPAGLLAVPIPGSRAKNLYDLVQRHLGKHGVTVRTVHRIDRFTSGIMIFAKRRRAYEHLVEQFKTHTPKRTYLALVRGRLGKEEGVLEHHLKLIRKGFRNIVVDPSEKGATPARLEYKVQEQYRDAALVAIRLDTGLKNQIRVQFEAVGHPLVGDQHYAPKEEKEPMIDRQALHAWKLSFEHPRYHKPVSYSARIPRDMKRLIDYYSGK